MILIYAPNSSTRFQYICRFIFKEQLGIGYTLTRDLEGFKAHDGARINYSHEPTDANIFDLSPHPLLFETGIQPQDIQCFPYNGHKAFFKAGSGDFGFDIFAASFYLISRYEEYLPHEKDIYGRYAHENSIAFKEGFLEQPVVHYWIKDLARSLTQKYPSLQFMYPSFSMKLTYDIDIAWSYKNKGLLRNIGGFLRSPSFTRIKVLTGAQKDPYDSYAFLDQLHEQYQLEPIYFFLVAEKRSQYDKNISPYSHSMWQLIKRHAKKYRIGLHPSWKSNESESAFQKEKKILETATNMPIHFSRQHYIKLDLPATYRRLAAVGISDDFSMGYGSINGFRASVASSFHWYDLEADQISKLYIHPFCFMDANSHYEQKLNVEQAFAELVQYYTTCKEAGIPFISIFHNNFLGNEPGFRGWREMYERFISQIQR